jgi:hypothetical protein
MEQDGQAAAQSALTAWYCRLVCLVPCSCSGSTAHPARLRVRFNPGASRRQTGGGGGSHSSYGHLGVGGAAAHSGTLSAGGGGHALSAGCDDDEEEEDDDVGSTAGVAGYQAIVSRAAGDEYGSDEGGSDQGDACSSSTDASGGGGSAVEEVDDARSATRRRRQRAAGGIGTSAGGGQPDVCLLAANTELRPGEAVHLSSGGRSPVQLADLPEGHACLKVGLRCGVLAAQDMGSMRAGDVCELGL